MAEPFKNWFNPQTVERIRTQMALPPAFSDQASAGLEVLELKDRVAHISAALRVHLPQSIPQALNHIVQHLPEAQESEEGVVESTDVWPLCTFVGAFAVDHPTEALDAIEHITQRFSCEFAIRPFLIHHPDQTLERLDRWVTHGSLHVRRLVSEGSRPRLPWGQRLTAFCEDPSPTLALIERLVDDPVLYVRRSVANHLNDVSKDHPDRAAEIGLRWMEGASKERAWVVRHALRGLVKAGHREALAAMGVFEPHLECTRWQLGSDTVQLGGTLPLQMQIRSTHGKAQKLVIDYAIHHQKANGRLTPKVFKWTTRTLGAGQTLSLDRAHPMKVVTTRRYHPGLHRAELRINGRSFGTLDFTLEMA